MTEDRDYAGELAELHGAGGDNAIRRFADQNGRTERLVKRWMNGHVVADNHRRRFAREMIKARQLYGLEDADTPQLNGTRMRIPLMVISHSGRS